MVGIMGDVIAFPRGRIRRAFVIVQQPAGPWEVHAVGDEPHSPLFVPRPGPLGLVLGIMLWNADFRHGLPIIAPEAA
jgi:hypothetical protein